jgi:serine protease Do
MKPSLMPWFTVTLVLGLSAAAKAQTDAHAKPGNPHGGGSLANKSQEQTAQTEAVLQEVVDHLQSTSRLYRTDNQPTSFRFPNWAENVYSGWDTWSRIADLSLAPVDDALRAHLPKDQGLIVTSLVANASAAQAGIQQNDVLLKLGDSSLAKPEDLDEGLKKAGDRPIELAILRGGKKLKVQVQPQVRVTMGPVQPEPPAFWIGISVSPLEPALRSQLRLPQNQGLLAIEVIKESAAAKAEVKVHDILLSLGGKPLDSQEKLVEVVQSNGEKPTPLELIREGKTLTIEVTPQRKKPVPPQIVNVNVDHPRTFSYYVVQPGLVREKPTGAGDSLGTLTLQSEVAAPEPEAAATMSKRLDDFDADIKQLRKVIEELSKVLKEKK